MATLKASAQNGAAVLGGRLAGSSLPGHHALDGRHVDGRRQVVAHGVEQRLHALVAQRRAASTGTIAHAMVPLRSAALERHPRRFGCPSRNALAMASSKSAAVSISFSRGGGDLVGHRGGRVVLGRGLGLVAREVERAHAHQVDDAGEAVLGAIGSWIGIGRAPRRVRISSTPPGKSRRRGPSC